MARLGTLPPPLRSRALPARGLRGGGSPRALLVLALLATACDAGTPTFERDGGLSDATIIPRVDGGVPPSDQRCFGHADDTLATDCRAEACAAVAACCVGSARAECCGASEIESIVDLRCSAGALEACLDLGTQRVAFGAELPIVEAGGLVPQGGLGHGGVALTESIDPRARNVRVEADVEVPAERCSECVDAVGIALLEAIPAPGQRAVVPFGALVSGSRNEVVVLIADEVVARRSLVPGALRLAVITRVDGRGEVLVNGETMLEVEGLSLPSRTSLAVFGRTSNRSGVQAVRVTSASASLAACDVPSALERRSTPVLPWSGASWAPSEVRRPSVVAWNDGQPRALMAYAFGGEIHLASRTGFGEFRHATADPGPPAFERPDALEIARDPWLVLDDDRFVLFFTGIDVEGRTSIWRALGGPARAQTFAPPRPVVDPDGPELSWYEALEQPTVLVGEPSWRMIARGRTASGVHLVELVSHDGGATYAPFRIVASPRSSDVLAFDRDDVESPALVVVPDAQGRSVVRLYYGARRGTRSSIGLYVEGGGSWRRMGEVLGPSDQPFDSFGVTDPAPLVEDGVLRLYYAGTDGARWRFGLAGPIGMLGE